MIQSVERRPTYTLSTDCGGALARPEHILQVWEHPLQSGHFSGLEVIAFRTISRLHRFIATAEESNIPVVSLHGRTGGDGMNLRDTVKLFGANTAIIPSENLISQFGTSHELLFHTPELMSQRVRRALLEKKKEVESQGLTLPTIWVENHHGERAVEDMMDVVGSLRYDGIPAQGMFDVCHFMTPEGLIDRSPHSFEHMLTSLDNYLKQTDDSLWRANGDTPNQLITGIHFPIGTVWYDSLPIDTYSDAMLHAFADVIRGRINRLVIENQQAGIISTVLVLPHKIEPQQERNTRLTQRLADTGIIYS